MGRFLSYPDGPNIITGTPLNKRRIQESETQTRRFDDGSRCESQRLKMLCCWHWRWKGPQASNILEVRGPNWISLGLKSWCPQGCIPSKVSREEWFSCLFWLLEATCIHLPLPPSSKTTGEHLQTSPWLCFLLPLTGILVIITLCPSENPG